MPVVLGLFLIAGTTFAQVQQGQQGTQVTSDDISDNELDQLTAIAMKQQNIQKEANQKFQMELNKYDALDFQRFQKIMMSKQNPQMADSVEVTKEEEAAIKELQPTLTEINQKAQKEVMAAIQESELTRQRLQAIQQAMQSDKDLQKRFRQMLMKKQQDSTGNSNS